MDGNGRFNREILAACGVLVIALWALIAFLIFQTHRVTVESAVSAGRNLARTLAEYQDSSVRAIDISLRELREHWLRSPATFDEAVARHEEHLHKEKVVQVAVIGADAWTKYSRLPQPGPLNFADRDYYKVQKARGTDELYISSPVLGRITKQWAIQVTRPIFDADKRFAGVIIVAVPPPALEVLLKDIDLGPNGVIMLARDDGTILARTGGLERTRDLRLADWPGIGAEAPPSGHLRFASAIDGQERLYAFRRLEAYPLTVYVGQDADAVLAPYYRDRNLLIGGGVLATILLVAVAILMISRARERAEFLDERERLMLELHDSSIQSIYAIGLTLENTRRMLQKNPAAAENAIADAGANLNLVIQDLRAFITAERRGAYSGAEFMEEIERMLPAAAQGVPRFSVEVDRAIIPGLAPQQAAHLLRIAREAISNIVRHASARNARLVLARQGDRVHLEISDDGVGIGAQAEARLGMGLHHIEARARRLRGNARIEAAPQHGTRVAVEFPHRA